jgi:hypothetical protein
MMYIHMLRIIDNITILQYDTFYICALKKVKKDERAL